MSADLLDQLLAPDALEFHFQPIFEVREGGRRVHSLEALTRGPAGTNCESAPVLFEYVRRKGREVQVDRRCVAGALRAAGGLGVPFPQLSLNVHAATLERDVYFPRFLVNAAKLLGISTGHVTVEIVEHAPGWGGPRFLKALEELRSHGVHIALDDVGLGHSNYRMILDCQPNYFKVDAHLVNGCHTDRRRQAILESLVLLSKKLGSRVIAEGVEHAEDLHALCGLGVELMQGFHLSPALAPGRIGDLLATATLAR